MKYSSSTRLLNLIIHTILFLGFGFIAIWFGFMMVPFLYNGLVGSPLLGVINAPTEVSWALVAQLGAFGIAAAIISGFGIYFSIKSIIHGNDDAPVRMAFAAYIAIGYLIALLLILNATWLYRTTTTNLGDGYDEIYFAVIVYTVLAIIVLLATNVPFVRLFGEETTNNKMLKTFALVVFSANLGVSLMFLTTYWASSGVDNLSNRAVFMDKLLILGLLTLGAAIFSLAGYVLASLNDKKNVEVKLPSFLFEFSLLFNVASFIWGGVYCYLAGEANRNSYFYNDYSLLNKITQTAVNTDYMDFLVMSVIIGSLLFFTTIALFFSTLTGGKKKAIPQSL